MPHFHNEMGGENLHFGKPFPLIYDLARRRRAEIAPDILDDAILAIGDGPKSDIQDAIARISMRCSSRAALRRSKP